jgi:hypothetical protein
MMAGVKAAIAVRNKLRSFVSQRAIPGVTSVELDMQSTEDVLIVGVNNAFRPGTVPDFYEGIAVRFMPAREG